MPDTGTAPNKTYTRSDGARTGTGVCVAERTAGDNNTAELCDARENDMATALSNRWMRDGGNKPSANIPMGGFKLTGAGDAVDPQDYMTFGQFFDTGTAMLFAQTAAPTGWTKSTANDDAALRVVSGTASSGGSTGFSEIFDARSLTGTTDGTALTVDQLAAHSHGVTDPGHTHNSDFPNFRIDDNLEAGDEGQYIQTTTTHVTSSSTTGIEIDDAGSGATHDHGFTLAADFAVKYVDCIIATRD